MPSSSPPNAAASSSPAFPSNVWAIHGSLKAPPCFSLPTRRAISRAQRCTSTVDTRWRDSASQALCATEDNAGDALFVVLLPSDLGALTRQLLRRVVRIRVIVVVEQEVHLTRIGEHAHGNALLRA